MNPTAKISSAADAVPDSPSTPELPELLVLAAQCENFAKMTAKLVRLTVHGYPIVALFTKALAVG